MNFPLYVYYELLTVILVAMRPPSLLSVRTPHCFVGGYGVNLRAEHDAGEEGEEETFKHSKQSQDEGQRSWQDAITAVKVLAHAAEEKYGHHGKSEH